MLKVESIRISKSVEEMVKESVEAISKKRVSKEVLIEIRKVIPKTVKSINLKVLRDEVMLSIDMKMDDIVEV